MKPKLSKNWWFLLIKGLLFIFFGALLTFYPKETMHKMFFLLGLIVLLSGIIILSLSLMNRKNNTAWQALLAFGMVDIALGLFIMIFTTLALHLLIILIGIWALLIGIYQLIQYFGMKKEERKGSMAPYVGLVAIILGLIMVFLPKSTGTGMTILVGVMSIVVGVLITGASFRLRKASA